MKALTRFLNRIAFGKTVLWFAILYILFPAYLLKNAEERINALAGKKVGVIDLTFGFDPQRALQMVADYGDEARAYYAKIEMTIDVVYPVVYAFLFGTILSLLYRHTQYKWVNAIPFVTMLADFIENINIVMLLKNFPEQSVNIAAMLEVIKLFKWISFGVIMLLIVCGLIMKLMKKGNAHAS